MWNSSFDQSLALMIDDEREIIDILFFAVIIFVISIMGSVANIINIIVFIKQGFQETVNISLMALTLSDLGSLLTLVADGIILIISKNWPDAPFNMNDVCYMLGVLPHAMFVRVSWLITSFITIERCLCVTMPLKIKRYVTASKTVAVIVCIYVCVFVGLSPYQLEIHLVATFNVQLNITRLESHHDQSAQTDAEKIKMANGIYTEVHGRASICEGQEAGQDGFDHRMYFLHLLDPKLL
ncbi:uncharacterized protein LOC131953786 [Physella acuta]|uniref:uncharacterized protein LOC131953786 n=1 Tax=Physella acuta TaxID=109671 RepID=UPI0027DDB8A2|nr:uncharacterized protein LOC131953786 [Physella acuta]